MEQKQDILIGRSAELKHFESIASSKEAEFVVVYGRRRVGKTFLVNTFFRDHYAFKLTGLAQKSKREQLTNFTVSLNRYGGGIKYKKPRTWYEAFNMLRDMLEHIHAKGRRVVFIDELPWMDSRGSNLVSACRTIRRKRRRRDRSPCRRSRRESRSSPLQRRTGPS